MSEPQNISHGIAMLLATFPEGHRLHDLGIELGRQARICASRRAAVLQHDDLRKRLKAAPVGFTRPEQWTGYIPPATINEFSEPEILRSPGGRPNQFGRMAVGELPNDSPIRAALVEISREAWDREHPLARRLAWC